MKLKHDHENLFAEKRKSKHVIPQLVTVQKWKGLIFLKINRWCFDCFVKFWTSHTNLSCCFFGLIIVNTQNLNKVQMSVTRIMGDSPPIEEHLTKISCSYLNNSSTGLGARITVIIWKDPNHDKTVMRLLDIYKIQTKRKLYLYPRSPNRRAYPEGNKESKKI